MQSITQVPLTLDTVVNLLGSASGIGWILNYILMTYYSFRDKTYSMSMLPLCCNIAWEFVYGVLYPSSTFVVRPVILSWLVLNCLVVYAAIKYSPNEWSHAPLVQRHLPLLFIVGIAACTGFHIALIRKFDPATAFLWSARSCQVLLSIGGLFQLLSRSSTKGGSYFLWLSRFLGSTCGVVKMTLMWKYGESRFHWLDDPLTAYCVATWILSDVLYGVVFYSLRCKELSGAGKAKAI
ncbi:hypothetical protein BDV19DRAFT_385403 [Aspergillus venezuelensis]